LLVAIERAQERAEPAAGRVHVRSPHRARERDAVRRRSRGKAKASQPASITPAADDEEERRAGLLLLGKGAVSAHRFDRPRAAGLDDDQQSWRGDRRHRDARLR
jgi:hypothetical protein